MSRARDHFQYVYLQLHPLHLGRPRCPHHPRTFMSVIDDLNTQCDNVEMQDFQTRLGIMIQFRRGALSKWVEYYKNASDNNNNDEEENDDEDAPEVCSRNVLVVVGNGYITEEWGCT